MAIILKIKIERLKELKKNKNFKFSKINLSNWRELKNFLKNKKFDAIIHLAANQVSNTLL